jgi:hypothetical protein
VLLLVLLLVLLALLLVPLPQRPPLVAVRGLPLLFRSQQRLGPGQGHAAQVVLEVGH